MTFALIFVIVVLLFVLALVSYVERVYTERGKFLSREFEENIESFEQHVEPRLKFGRERAALSVAILEQLSTAAIAMLVGYMVFYNRIWTAADAAEAALALVVMVVVFNRLLPFVLFSRTRGGWMARFTIPLRALLYLVMPVTLVIGFCISVMSLTHERARPEPERPSEAVDALIEAGQEEGILEESDRDLIQSVVEFGDKTVREVMKPRPEMFAVPATTTVEQLTDMLRTRPYSRVPVFEGTIDQVIGIVHARDLLQVADTEAHTRTVRQLMKTAVHFVPESKRVSDLLREMQRDNIRLEMVVDEYGAVAGLVTIEDMVEEIVGEIRDEGEKGVIRESDHSYIVPGSMDIDRLDELFGVRPEGHEATTVAGLVTEIAGRIPQKGEVINAEGLRFEVLESTDRRVERLRISSLQHAKASS
jgi:CBS domain containing-hemolysin-like protein